MVDDMDYTAGEVGVLFKFHISAAEEFATIENILLS